MREEININKYLLKYLDELKEDTKTLSETLKEHMEKEDSRWEYVQNQLTAIKVDQETIRTKMGYYDGTASKLFTGFISFVISLITYYFLKK